MFPPFEGGRVWATNAGRLWVQRSLPADSAPTFDVFDRSGDRVAIVKLPVGRRIIGFGSEMLYATSADADGLLTLERYKMPWFGA